MTLKVGLVGCGRACADLHLPALERLDDVQVVALADVDQDRLMKVADQYLVPCRYHDFLELVGDSTIDVVGVCVPVGGHVDVALSALDAGKHVFVEKPVALNLEDAARLAQRSASSGRKVMVGHNLRFHRLVGPARALLKQEGLGRVDTVQAVWTTDMALSTELPVWRRSRSSGGGVLFEMAVHHFDLVGYLLDDPIRQVMALGRDGGSEDSGAVVTARTRSGVLVSYSFSQESVVQNFIRINGEAGNLELDLYRFDGLRFWSAGQQAGNPKTRLRHLVETARQLPAGIRGVRTGGDYVVSYVAEWRAFVDCILQDSPSPCSVEEGAKAVAVTLAATTALREGRPVEVDTETARILERA
ncbi:MAG: Gfo/Idh/MocA family oxidoreductase [Thermoanaerobaculia bacterium]